MFVHERPWSAVDPTGRSFDPARAGEIATALITPATGTRAIDRRALEAAIDHALARAADDRAGAAAFALAIHRLSGPRTA